MIDTFVKLLEKLTQLAEVREKNREKFIDRYVAPVYSDAEIIYKDYISLLRTVRSKVLTAEEIKPILEFLEAKRQDNFATRTKVRALLNERMRSGTFTRFERGIWGLMMGSVTAFDRGHCSFHPISMGDHTLLDITEHLSDRGVTKIDAEDRADMLRFIDRQIEGLEVAWSEVVQGYASFMSEVIPKTSLEKKHVYKYERD